MEKWKRISCSEFHFISTKGRVKSIDRYVTHNYGGVKIVKGQILKTPISNKYKGVSIKRVRYNIHRLVAQEFIPNPNNYPCVNHIDGDKLNNNVDNLEWCSYSYNLKHSYDTKLRKRVWSLERIKKVSIKS